MPARRCPGIDGHGCGQITASTRCPAHTAAVDREHLAGKRRRRPYSRAEQTRRAATVAAWTSEYGWLCPGWRRPAHRVSSEPGSLTADHPVEVAAGGSEQQSLTVLCRSCNSAKGRSIVTHCA